MDVAAYGALHAAGAALGLVLAFRTADRAGLPRAPSTAFLVAGFVGAFVAAKAATLLVGGGDGASLLRTGGSSGLAVPAALAIGLVAASTLRLPVGRLLDAACAGAAAGLAVARLGCVAAGCCGGAPTDAAVVRAIDDACGYPRVQPLPLYEAVVLGVVAVVLVRRAPTARAGTTAAWFAVAWGVVRTAVLLARPATGPAWLVPTEHAAAAACVVAGTVVLVRRTSQRGAAM